MPPDLGGVTALAFTSETGVAAFCRHSTRRRYPVWVVGPQTARAALDAGFHARQGPGDAEGLVAFLMSEPPEGRLLYCRGEKTAFPLEDALISAGIDTVSWVGYRQVDLPLSATGTRILAGEQPVVLPVFSAEGARRAARACEGATAPIHVAAISPAVAKAFDSLAWRIETAPSPDEAGMIVAVGILADQTQRA